MYIILTMLTASVVLLILTGFFLEFNPEKIRSEITIQVKKGIGLNLLLFAGGMIAIMFIGIQDVVAAEEAVTQAKEISVGLGLALIGIGLPTGLATIGAGIAVSSVGAASLAVITEKPEIFGRTLIYLGLAEGIAIYGLVVTILFTWKNLMRILAIGSQALMDGFSLLGIETHTKLSTEALEELLTNILRQQERTLIYLQQGIAKSDLPILQRLRHEGGFILISEIPPLNEPDKRHSPIDALIAKVIGPSALEKIHEQSE